MAMVVMLMVAMLIISLGMPQQHGMNLLPDLYHSTEYDIGEKEKTTNHSSLPLTWERLMRAVNG